MNTGSASPSPPSSDVLSLLHRYESRNITYMAPDGSWPIVWQRAQGTRVWDAEGKKYLDLTAAFGVAAAGHANPRVVRAGQRQMKVLLHAMGDVHPHALKAQLAAQLSHLTFERWSQPTTIQHSAKTIFCNSGFEAVEAALKTALLATGRPDVIAFQKAYHGLGYGALNATERAHFRLPFASQLREFGHFVPFPAEHRNADLQTLENQLRDLLGREQIGAILTEPIQVRGGLNVPPEGFLPLLRRLCDEFRALLILDEIYTGFGRTGAWFCCEHFGVIPDVVCLGKALSGGFPISACVGRADVMDRAWPPSQGEAIHTSTFLGHPVGCAMALANLGLIERQQLVPRTAEKGRFLKERLEQLDLAGQGSPVRVRSRGMGLLMGCEVTLPDGAPATQAALQCVTRLLHRGFIVLPEGEYSNVIGLTPPLTISKRELGQAVEALSTELLRSHPGP
jgi:4-aminobutyrate aminotransferase-like enzyme